MPTDRHIDGDIAFPRDAVAGRAASITVELRDVSLQDQPSTVLASTRLKDVPVGPGQRVRFEMRAPAAASHRSLAMRVQVDMHAGQLHAAGDYLSTVTTTVAAQGDVRDLLVPVSRL